MTKKAIHFCSLIISIILICITISGASYAQTIEPEVLTLFEAAIFLRVEPATLKDIAKQNMLPGRLIGNEWRFSKTALLSWLSGQEIKKQDVLSVSEMSIIEGRGSDLGIGGNPGSQAVDKTPEVIGIKSDLVNAADVFLRNEKVLLKSRELSVELGLMYSYSDQQNILLSSEWEEFRLNLGVSYGLSDNLQLFASIPYAYKTETVNALEELNKERKSHVENITLGFRRSVLQEGVGKPEVLLSIEGQLPTSDNSYGLGISAAFVKSLDPAVLFANIAYQYNLKQSNWDLLLSAPKSIISASFGYAYALNDTLTIGTSVSGIFPQSTVSGNNSLSQTKKQFSLQLGITSLLSKNLYIEPSVSIGLNRVASDVTLGASLVYTFGSASK